MKQSENNNDNVIFIYTQKFPSFLVDSTSVLLNNLIIQIFYRSETIMQLNYRNLKDLLGTKYGMGATRYGQQPQPQPSRPETRSSSRQAQSRPSSKGKAVVAPTTTSKVNYFQKTPLYNQSQAQKPQDSNSRTPANSNNTSFNSFVQEKSKVYQYLDQSFVVANKTPPPPQSTPKQLIQALPKSRNNSNHSRNGSSSSFNNQANHSPSGTSTFRKSHMNSSRQDSNRVDDFKKMALIKQTQEKAKILQKLMNSQQNTYRQQSINQAPQQQNFFQLDQQQSNLEIIQSPQFRGNIELMNLIKQQTSREIPSVDQEDDEKLIVDTQITVNKQNFIFHFVIGKGGFGKVWKVELKKSRQFYAMKEMNKSKIIAKRSVNSVMNEKELLTQLSHPFMVNMTYAFQDRQNLYLVMDLLTGGDLRFHIGKMRKFKEHQTKFFMACMLIGLEYLHNNNIIHRDIKPENLVLDKKGYVRITDLGIARRLRPDNANDTSGTPGYMAPEVMYHQNHGIAVDYFAMGVICYEFMLGRRPYNGRSRKEIREQILAKNVQVKREEAPSWSTEGIDFCNRLIQRKPQNRLGFNGPSEVKSHPWLRGIPWERLEQKLIEPPYVPSSIDENFDYRQQISEDDDSQDELIQQNTILLRKNSVQNLFAGYSYDGSKRVTKSTASTHSTTTHIHSQLDTYHNNFNKMHF